jgi:hypothetical protein
MTRGGGRVSVRHSVQALSGFVIRQRPRVRSRAVIPALAYQLDVARGRASVALGASGRPIIHIEAAVLGRLRAMRKLGERYPLDGNGGDVNLC